MDHLGTLNAFVQAAETGSFVAAARQMGLTASAIGKAVTRLEQHLGVRLFNRNTRSMTLTDEGQIFLDRCRRIFQEIAAAEAELTQALIAPSGRLRVSMPLVGMLFMPVIAQFMATYPAIVLDLDFSDRLVDVIEEGFDVVIRTGTGVDSRLMRQGLGKFTGELVAAPSYLEKRGMPETPAELTDHDCLRQRSPGTGKLHDWPLRDKAGIGRIVIPEMMSANTIDPLVHLAERGVGIAFLPPFAVSTQIAQGSLVSLMKNYVERTGEFAAVWPTNRQVTPKVRAFVRFLSEKLDLEGASLSL